MTLTFYLNNTVVNPPKNWKELGIECNFADQEFYQQQITINDWEFVRENIDLINSWNNIFEGIPYRIEQTIETTGQVVTLFDGYLDLSDNARFNEYSITAKSKAHHSVDWLTDVSDSVTWVYLYYKGVLTPSDFIDVPYVISSIPDYEKVLSTVVSIALLTNAIINLITNITGDIAAVAADPFEYGLILKLILEILELIALLIATVKLVQQMFELLIQRIKYAKGVYVKTLLKKGCSYLGLTFHSSIIDPANDSSDSAFGNLVILPRRYVVDKSSNSTLGILGAFSSNDITQLGFPDGTIGDLFRKLKTMFNAKVIISGNDIYLERKDFYLTNPLYTIPDIDINNAYSLNSNEANANYVVEFQTDVSDSNTITEYKGTIYQQTITPQWLQNQYNRTIKGLKDVRIEYALGKRKTELTTIENLFYEGFSLLDKIVGTAIDGVNLVIDGLNAAIDFINTIMGYVEAAVNVFGDWDYDDIKKIKKIKYTPLSSLITDRINCLKLQHDYYNIDKVILIGSDGRLATDIETKLSAKNIFNKYHIINTFAFDADNPNQNQYKLIQYNSIPFTITDFLRVQNNPLLFNQNGVKCKVESIKFDVWNERADIKIKEPHVYCNSLVTTYYEYDGK